MTRSSQPAGEEALPRWQELSKEQQCVLFSAAEQSTLIGVLANWEPEQDWPVRILHVTRLAEAAESLLRADLIVVYEQDLESGEAALLFADEALRIIKDPVSWWREEVGEDGRPGKTASSAAVFYSVAITGKGGAVLRTRGDDNLYAYPNH
jgi:hypothetical protein